MPDFAPEPLLTIDEVAEILRLGEETVRRYIRRDKLSAIRQGGKLFVKPAEIDRYLERNDSDRVSHWRGQRRIGEKDNSVEQGLTEDDRG